MSARKNNIVICEQSSFAKIFKNISPEAWRVQLGFLGRALLYTLPHHMPRKTKKQKLRADKRRSESTDSQVVPERLVKGEFSFNVREFFWTKFEGEKKQKKEKKRIFFFFFFSK